LVRILSLTEITSGVISSAARLHSTIIFSSLSGLSAKDIRTLEFPAAELINFPLYPSSCACFITIREAWSTVVRIITSGFLLIKFVS